MYIVVLIAGTNTGQLSYLCPAFDLNQTCDPSPMHHSIAWPLRQTIDKCWTKSYLYTAFMYRHGPLPYLLPTCPLKQLHAILTRTESYPYLSLRDPMMNWQLRGSNQNKTQGDKGRRCYPVSLSRSAFADILTPIIPAATELPLWARSRHRSATALVGSANLRLSPDPNTSAPTA